MRLAFDSMLQLHGATASRYGLVGASFVAITPPGAQGDRSGNLGQRLVQVLENAFCALGRNFGMLTAFPLCRCSSD